MKNQHTLSNKVPPSRVERIVWSPASDVLPICFTRTVLVGECRSHSDLAVQFRECVHIAYPSNARISYIHSRRTMDLRVRVKNFEGLVRNKNSSIKLTKA